MTVSPLSAAALALLGAGAGWLGSLIGIGGGVIIVPALTLGAGWDLRVAVATSLVAVIATSTTAGSVYVAEGLTNMRLGMTLEIATTLGGVVGGLLATTVPVAVLAWLFAVVLVVTAALLVQGARRPPERTVHPVATRLAGWEEPGRLAGTYYDDSRGGLVHYQARRLPLGWSVSLLAGAVSGMLGVGGGFLKVPAMNLGMGVPVKVAAATSNFMIGVTAAASATIYFARGFLHPLLAAPLVLGVIAGSALGTLTARRVRPAALKVLMAIILLLVAAEMTLRTPSASAAVSAVVPRLHPEATR